MQVRQLIGAHAGEVVHMPYHIALRALASGTIELVEHDEAPAAEGAERQPTGAERPPVSPAPAAPGSSSRSGRRRR